MSGMMLLELDSVVPIDKGAQGLLTPIFIHTQSRSAILNFHPIYDIYSHTLHKKTKPTALVTP